MIHRASPAASEGYTQRSRNSPYRNANCAIIHIKNSPFLRMLSLDDAYTTLERLIYDITFLGSCQCVLKTFLTFCKKGIDILYA